MQKHVSWVLALVIGLVVGLMAVFTKSSPSADQSTRQRRRRFSRTSVPSRRLEGRMNENNHPRAGVTGAQVDLAKKQAVVAGSAEQEVMAKAVAEAGFKVVGYGGVIFHYS